MADDLYKLLGVEPEASGEEIKAAYRRIARQVHPDAGGNAALFCQIQEAFDTLSDPQRRAAYDRTRTAAPGPPEPEPEPEWGDSEWSEVQSDPEDDGWVVVDDAPSNAPRRDGTIAPARTRGALVARWLSSAQAGGAGIGAVAGVSWGLQVATFSRGGGAMETAATFVTLFALVGAFAWPPLVARRGARGALRVAALAVLGPALAVVFVAWLGLRGGSRSAKQ